ncbi:MAG: L,D-transpeptidase [Akkermansiaceae bacterium]|nr:L,D-transpeptidase [Akkermansiaceae bacterium]
MQLRVSIARQELEVRDGPEVLRRYPVSTSRFGPGCEENSFKTPLGRFRIAEKHGHDAPPYTIFRGRRPEGTWAPGEGDDADLVLTRILWLEGLEPANSNTYDRYIYIHGTNHEEHIGTPASQGCIRMRTNDLLELFDIVPEGTAVTICEV